MQEARWNIFVYSRGYRHLSWSPKALETFCFPKLTSCQLSVFHVYGSFFHPEIFVLFFCRTWAHSGFIYSLLVQCMSESSSTFMKSMWHSQVLALMLFFLLNQWSFILFLKTIYKPPSYLLTVILCPSRAQKAVMTWILTTRTPCLTLTSTVTTTTGLDVLERLQPFPTTATVPWGWPMAVRWQVWTGEFIFGTVDQNSVLSTFDLKGLVKYV